jgi:hypothetical protein
MFNKNKTIIYPPIVITGGEVSEVFLKITNDGIEFRVTDKTKQVTTESVIEPIVLTESNQ